MATKKKAKKKPKRKTRKTGSVQCVKVPAGMELKLVSKKSFANRLRRVKKALIGKPKKRR